MASGLRLSGATPCDTWIGRQVVLHGAPFGARVDGPGGALWSRFSQVLMRGIGGGWRLHGTERHRGEHTKTKGEMSELLWRRSLFQQWLWGLVTYWRCKYISSSRCITKKVGRPGKGTESILQWFQKHDVSFLGMVTPSIPTHLEESTELRLCCISNTTTSLVSAPAGVVSNLSTPPGLLLSDVNLAEGCAGGALILEDSNEALQKLE